MVFQLLMSMLLYTVAFWGTATYSRHNIFILPKRKGFAGGFSSMCPHTVICVVRYAASGADLCVLSPVPSVPDGVDQAKHFLPV